MKNLTITLIVLASSTLVSAHANQSEPETWECYALSVAAMVSEQRMTVRATSDPAHNTGTVSVNTLQYDAEYMLQGFVRVWVIRHEKLVESVDMLVIAPDFSGTLYLGLSPDNEIPAEDESEDGLAMSLICEQAK